MESIEEVFALVALMKTEIESDFDVRLADHLEPLRKLLSLTEKENALPAVMQRAMTAVNNAHVAISERVNLKIDGGFLLCSSTQLY